MAERRMFAKTIVLSDAFLDMPLSARCLYFTFGMLADDDGFVNSPKSIMRQSGASNDDLNLLIAKKFILTFDSGVIVIKHWRINNYLRNDRYKETTYLEEKNALVIKENGVYDAGIPNGIPAVYPSGIPSIEKQDRSWNRRLNVTYTAQIKNLILYGEMCLGEIGRQNLHISADIIATMPKGYGTYSTVKLSVNLCVMKLL